MSAELVSGVVMHRRLRPVGHRFSHRVFFMRLKLSSLEQSCNRLFSLNRFNLLSFFFSDHGARDGTHPDLWIRALLWKEHIACEGEVWLHCFPRVLGYVFNPVSFWFCHARDGSLVAVVAEVSNTFGEHHAYLLAYPDGRPIKDGDMLAARKLFHVSPFLPVAGDYAFRFTRKGGLHRARIDYLAAGEPVLLTSITGRAEPLTSRAALRACLAHPLMTLGVMAGIHWQALRLWVRRVPFFRKPSPPPASYSR